MKDNAKGFIWYLLIVCVGVAGLLVVLRNYHQEPIIKLVPVQSPIPSAIEIQQRLKDLDNPRYDPGKVDGIIGKQSQKVWDDYIKDQFAKRAIEGIEQ